MNEKAYLKMLKETVDRRKNEEDDEYDSDGQEVEEGCCKESKNGYSK